jgi:hypothetical protein
MNHWYLSFGLNSMTGACVVAGETLSDAIQRSHELGINPGGAVLALHVPDRDACSLPHDRLLNLKELHDYGPLISWEELLCQSR